MIKTKKTNCVLGINVSHNASASLMYKGEILLCLQEERLTNKKNFLDILKNQLIIVLILQKKNHLKLIRQYLQHKSFQFLT